MLYNDIMLYNVSFNIDDFYNLHHILMSSLYLSNLLQEQKRGFSLDYKILGTYIVYFEYCIYIEYSRG